MRAFGLTVFVALWFAWSPCALAHEGPPFPIVVDRHIGNYVVSVWTDPDVGVGTFFVILEAAPGSVLPAENSVQVCVQPKSGRLPEVCYPAGKQDLRQLQYYAAVEFDRQEFWRVRVRVSGPGGTGDIETEVAATPPGYGAWDLLIYGFPFLLFGLLWLCVALRRRRAADSHELITAEIDRGTVRRDQTGACSEHESS